MPRARFFSLFSSVPFEGEGWGSETAGISSHKKSKSSQLILLPFRESQQTVSLEEKASSAKDIFIIISTYILKT